MRHLLLSLLLLPALCFAESSVWQVSKGGKHIYLAGTMHLLKQEDYPLPREFDYAYKRSKIMVFETDLQALAAPEFQQAVLSKALYPQGQTIESVLSPQVMSRLRRFCEQKQIPLDNMLNMKAGMLSTTLSMVEMAKQGLAEEGVDAHYYVQAKKDGKPVSGLETAEQQINFIANMGKGNESALISQTLDDMEELPQMVDAMRRIWREGDVSAMAEEVVNPIQQDYPDIYIQLLAQRNVNWLPYLEGLLQTPQVEMVLVGAAHMAGEHGLHNLLRARGYSITQIKAPI